MTQLASMGGDTSADNQNGGGGETIAPRPYVLGDVSGLLNRDELAAVDAWWRAANYLAVGQIYLSGNPLLREPLVPQHIKPRLLGHFGTVPGLNLVWVHANRQIAQRGLNAVFVAGPGHGGPGPNACAWLEGTYSELYSYIPQDATGMAAFFAQFSYPGGVPSHCAPETPGSFHEGGELGYSLLHAFGAAFDNPDLTVFCVVGDGEAETGPLATSWHANTFLNPVRDGAVLPILALNQYKIANPTILARMPESRLLELLRGYGYEPHVVSGNDPAVVHQAMAETLEVCLDRIEQIQQAARAGGVSSQQVWPMIVLRTPKGWTCPPVVDGQQVEGTFRAHQVPLPAARTDERHRQVLEEWLRSYRPEELFDDTGRPVRGLLDVVPGGDRRMSANPVANGGTLLRDLRLPDWRDYGVEVSAPGATEHEATRVLGGWLRDVTDLNRTNFLTFAPDELASNRLQDILEVTGRDWQAEVGEFDEKLDPQGRLIEVLSEHMCEGLLEGYLLSGRHGLFTCYEAFIHIVDAMFNQHAKWLDASAQVAWRRPIASLNYLLSSHVWRQDHNGFTHQDPGTTVTSRLLAILGAFDERHRSLTLTAVARRAGMPVPTAHRLIGGLIEGGALQRLADGRYAMGPLTWRAGLLAPVGDGLQRVAEPFLHDVYAATLATVHLAVRDSDQVLYLERMAGRMSVPILSEVGSRLPMHATGVGKVLLAHAPADVQARVCANLTRITPHTITRPNVLRAQLALIRREGVATTSEEMSRGACSLAVPVVQSSDGAVVAAIGVVVATLKRDRQRLLGALQVAARGISRLM